MASEREPLNLGEGAKAAIRAYVTQAPTTHLAEGTVAVTVTHSNLKAHRVLELRVDLAETVAEVKERLYTFNGTSASFMQLTLMDGERVVALMSSDTATMGEYGVGDGMTLHVTDLDPHSLSKNGGLEDVSQIEKYTMSEDEYEKRENTLRSWKRNLLATDPEKAYKLFPSLRPKPLPEGVPEVTEPASVEGVSVGDRCEVTPGARRGTVAHVGKVVELGMGYWVGVHFDEPVGKSDGSVQGKRYFEAEARYGAFVRGHNVAVGDFPPAELDIGDVMEGEAPAATAAGAPAPAAPAAAAASADTAPAAPSAAEAAMSKYQPGSRSSGLRVVRRGVDEEDEDDDDDEL